MMKKTSLWIFVFLMTCYLADAVELMPVQEKTDITNYQPVLTPPEGNTTFLDGTSWCVARPGASQGDLQDALDWACGMGKTDCSPIKSGGPCFEPNTLLSHASFAFNSYYQQNGNSDIACNFGGTATLTKRNPNLYELRHLHCQGTDRGLCNGSYLGFCFSYTWVVDLYNTM
ncbi:major pollen allergen Ole e 10-like isoform X2 [Apium graveolens]|uniref:major pollen allergen Ole e 10-like isoform X2 n=1 Tax=Apium graveolens TaxID=4045 RepID=UPI003D7AE8DC